jgi:hypothetical protein
MTKNLSVWEVANGDDQFVSCADCAFAYLLGIGIKDAVLGANYSSEDGLVSASEDVFSQHTESQCEVAHVCSGCDQRLDD